MGCADAAVLLWWMAGAAAMSVTGWGQLLGAESRHAWVVLTVEENRPGLFQPIGADLTKYDECAQK
jgi:hypothetical protein